MNCFHFSVSLGYKTTPFLKKNLNSKLWIAFIFQYLWDTKQPPANVAVSAVGCELLSFFSIFGIQNNKYFGTIVKAGVVDCFHFSVSLGYKTTFNSRARRWNWLWIAFIFQYLWDTKQQNENCKPAFWSCELLSFFSIFGIQNNYQTASMFL